MDFYVRKTWALLIESGRDASYSSALNFMLLATIFETQKPEGLSEKTRELIWNFIEDQKTIDELNLEDFATTFKEKIRIDKTKPYIS
jgi:hypothetical protein